jgi:tetratricopeptide (TPR) repeat protein
MKLFKTLSLISIVLISTIAKSQEDYLLLGKEKLEQELYLEAIQDLRDAYNNAQGDNNKVANAAYYLSLANYKINEIGEAIRYIDESITYGNIDDDAALPYILKAKISLQTFQYETAIICLDKAIMLNKDLSESYLLKAQYYLETNKLPEACENFQLATAKGDKSAEEISSKICK